MVIVSRFQEERDDILHFLERYELHLRDHPFTVRYLKCHIHDAR